MAGTPRIYGQLVKTLAPYTRVITEAAAEEGADGTDGTDGGKTPADEVLGALQAAEAAQAEAQPAEAPKRRRITAAVKAAEDSGERPVGRDDAPF